MLRQILLLAENIPALKGNRTAILQAIARHKLFCFDFLSSEDFNEMFKPYLSLTKKNGGVF
jgi:hypothetical protein